MGRIAISPSTNTFSSIKVLAYVFSLLCIYSDAFQTTGTRAVRGTSRWSYSSKPNTDKYRFRFRAPVESNRTDEGTARLAHRSGSSDPDSSVHQSVVKAPPRDDETSTPASSSPIRTATYKYRSWTISYRYKEANDDVPSSTTTKVPPLFLIHPVGIGLSNWYWERLLQRWPGRVYAPNLIGCGRAEDKDDPLVWDDPEQGIHFPLDWVRGCEALLDEVARLRVNNEESDYSDDELPCVVVAQGGLAPIGLLLAHRDETMGYGRVGSLVMASPPSWGELTGPGVPADELARNLEFLRSPLWGDLAFQLLESRLAIRLFSNLFLFDTGKKSQQRNDNNNDGSEGGCDESWLDETMVGCADPTRRPPVQAFNAGLLLHRSYIREFTELTMPTLLLLGHADRRQGRIEYVETMARCKIRRIQGLNVLPWENPGDTSRAIEEFVRETYHICKEDEEEPPTTTNFNPT